MNARTADQIRFLITLVAMIAIAAAMGFVPSLWAAL